MNYTTALQPKMSREQRLSYEISQCYDDPLRYVMLAFPWGVEGTDLANQEGPDDWQVDQLEYIRCCIQDDPLGAILDATTSGHGVGKTAEVSWLILWAMSTRKHLFGTVTANTKTQLTTKTWRELAVWHKRAINTHWFKYTATKFMHVKHHETWFVSAIPNSEENSEAFAGQHAEHTLIIYDEASNIPNVIWEVSEGATTTERVIWVVYGNPTKNTGRFRDIFRPTEKRWHTRKVNSETAKMVVRERLKDWEEAYGRDSDFYRVRALGEFPTVGSTQFIAEHLVDAAMNREVLTEAYYFQPTVMGVDIARGGEDGGDLSVAVVRQGRKVHKIQTFQEQDTMELINKLIPLFAEYNVGLAYVDEVGVGAGVVDRLRQLGYNIVGVNAGKLPDDEKLYKDKRVEMADRGRFWLKEGGDLPYDVELRKEMTGIEYGHITQSIRGELLCLERKRDTKARGLSSPDRFDAFMHTFFHLVAPAGMPNVENQNFVETDEWNWR